MLAELLKHIKQAIDIRMARIAFKRCHTDADAAELLDFIERRAYRINGGDARKAREFVKHIAALRQECQLLDERDRLRAELKALRAERA